MFDWKWLTGYAGDCLGIVEDAEVPCKNKFC